MIVSLALLVLIVGLLWLLRDRDQVHRRQTAELIAAHNLEREQLLNRIQAPERLPLGEPPRLSQETREALERAARQRAEFNRVGTVAPLSDNSDA